MTYEEAMMEREIEENEQFEKDFDAEYGYCFDESGRDEVIEEQERITDLDAAYIDDHPFCMV